MILRGLLSGNVVLFEEALTELSGMPLDRVTGYIHDKNLSGFLALYRKAGLPDAAYAAFREAIAAMREGVLMGGQGNAARLRRAMVERVLAGCQAEPGADAVDAGAAAALLGRSSARGSAHVLRRSGGDQPGAQARAGGRHAAGGVGSAVIIRECG